MRIVPGFAGKELLMLLVLAWLSEPQSIFYKDNANECNENLFSDCRVQLIFYKDTNFCMISSCFPA